VLRISGILKQSEFSADQSALARKKSTADQKPRSLVILEKFEDGNVVQIGTTSIFFSHIVIVANPRWETLALAFAGAGVRRAPVKFFPPNELEQAQSWLTE
jgi:stage II sporulation SpoAA-like protein